MEFECLLTTSEDSADAFETHGNASLKTPWCDQNTWVIAAGLLTTVPHVQAFFPFLSTQAQWWLQARTTEFPKCPLDVMYSPSDITRCISRCSPYLLVFICLAESHPAPGFSSLLSSTMRSFSPIIFIISNVFHKLDLKRENSPPYFQSDYQMMMDNRLIRVIQGDTSSCV